MWECPNCKQKNNSCKSHIEHLLKIQECLIHFNKENNIEIFLTNKSLDNWNKSGS